MATLKIDVVEAEAMGRCFCGCNGEVPEGKYWLPGHDHRAVCNAIKAFGGSHNLIASLGLAPKRRGRKAGGTK